MQGSILEGSTRGGQWQQAVAVAPEQASGPVSSGEELQTSAEGATDLSMVPPIPKLDHRITIKGRTAYASRIPGTLSSAPLRQSSQPPSPSVPATAPAAHHNPPDNLQTAPSLPSLLASAPTAHRNLPDNLQTAPTLTSLPANALPAHLNSPDNHSSRTSAPLNPHNAQAPCATDGAQHPSKDHALKAETAVRAGESRPSSSSSNSSSCKATPAGNGAAALCSHGSVEAAPAAASNFSSSKSSWRRAAHAQGGGMQAQGPVFLLDGRWFNARGEEVGAEDGVPGRDASSSMPPSLLSSLAPQGAAPLLPHMPRHAGSYERPAALASAMRELGVHHLAPAPTSFASTATPFSSNGNFTVIQQSKQLHTMSGCLTQLDLPRLHPSALPRRSTSLTRSSSNSLHDARSSTGKKQGRVGVSPNNREEAAGVRAVASESNKGRRSRDLADADDVEKDLESALEAHIAQLTDVGGSNALAPQSSSSTSSDIPQPSQHTQPDASNLSSKHACSTSVAGSSIPRTTQHTQPSTCDLSSWLTSSSSNTSMTGSSIPRPSQHTQPGVNDLSSRCASGSSSTSMEGSSIPRPSQHTQPGVNDLSSRRASSRNSTSMAGSSKKPPSTVAHAKPNSQAAGTQIHAPTHTTTHAATHATTHVKQPGRKTLPTCIPAPRHPSSSNSKSTSAAHKDGTHNKGRSGPSTAAVGSSGRDESEEDDGDGFAEQLAQAIEAQIHTQAVHTAPPRPPLNTKRGTASGVHAAVKDDQVAPPRLGIPASHHTAAIGAIERVRQQQNR
ncbi:hypothetical protein DUNSADRAFT_13801 [Dunaliella salina]|uniref:Uncharacterized protein n=1 Tax=Dunaliella salina TaxID=3046 RepID=A0ABQ7G8N8_DUNSA|nr:hypothetical protein DUNSADRAFT_13801 [Dunaliella salina]|eukprot:KAF5830970.1 hypothetical protein DUNSADRAFT_13801 [Dunaliella salina]